MKNIKLVAFDLDGTITQHKQPMCPENRAALTVLSQKYKLFYQMEGFPIDIIGNYGLQYGKYNASSKTVDILRDLKFDTDRESIEKRVTMLWEKYGYTEFSGDNVEYHPSACLTFPILGTKAKQEDKLAFDLGRKKRRAIYDDVARVFDDYVVFVGGSSSFDMAPKPYNKYYALDLYCKENNLSHSEVCYVGDDYGLGGNDESVYKSDFNYLTIDNYLDFPKVVSVLL